jgi:hypothetical protein
MIISKRTKGEGMPQGRSWGCDIVAFIIIFSFSAHFLPTEAFAKVRVNKKGEMTMDLSGVQPYPHQWVETNRKSGVSVFGQVYRARPNLVVFEMTAYPEARTEIKSVKIKTADGKIYEGKIRRLPLNFMPQARKNYQSPPPPTEVRT